jgi:hypothetical protein
MECDFHRTSYRKIIFEDLKCTWARAPRVLEIARKVLGKTYSRPSSEELEDDSINTWKPALLGYEKLGGLSWIDSHVPESYSQEK